MKTHMDLARGTYSSVHVLISACWVPYDNDNNDNNNTHALVINIRVIITTSQVSLASSFKNASAPPCDFTPRPFPASTRLTAPRITSPRRAPPHLAALLLSREDLKGGLVKGGGLLICLLLGVTDMFVPGKG